MTLGLDPFAPVVIRASAGTGKTFQLSNRFLELAAAGEPLDSILAATFTRKAAGEILDRVLARLAEAATDDRKLAELSRHLHRPLDQAGCLRLLRRMVRQLHRLRVGTLDSFFLQVARSFSLELGLVPGWQIADEVTEHRLRAEAIRAVLREESTTDVVNLMSLLTKGEATRSVSEQIASLVKDLYSIFLEAPAGAWQALERHKELPAEELQRAIESLEAIPVPEGKRLADARTQDLERARQGDWLGFLTKGLAPKILDGTNAYYNQPIPQRLAGAYRPLIAQAKAAVLGRIANQTDATRRLLERFDEAYQRLKTAQRAMRFEDVTHVLRRGVLLERLEQIAFRLDGRIAHLLLDEFQDTAPLQWHVLRPLSRSVTGSPGRCSFFCVGDVKQAIYGWRGGVAEIFDALGDELPQIQQCQLTQSFRSSQVVIDTVNRVFQSLRDNEALRRHADAAARWAARFEPHTTAKTDLAGHCRMIVAPEAGEDQDQNVMTLQAAADLVVNLCREAPGRSIGVLVRRNVAVARMIYELRQRNVEASEEGGNPLSDSPAVQLVLSLLTLADHPGDTAARFHIAHSPLADLVGLTSYEDDAAAWRASFQLRESLMNRGYGPTLYAWMTRLASQCDRRDLDRLRQLVAVAYRYQVEATGRVDDFVELIRQQKIEDPRSALVRVMTVHQSKGLQFDIVVLPELDFGLAGQPPQLVVGRPKPTEAIHHVCRYVAKDLRPLLPPKLVATFNAHERQMVEESLCVLYVALTRAIHALHLLVAPSKPNEKTIPATLAGLLRAALANGRKAFPGGVLYEDGRPDWMRVRAAKTPVPHIPLPEGAVEVTGQAGIAAGEDKVRPRADAAPQGEETSLRIAPSRTHALRGLDRITPSQLEGGGRVHLSQLMRVDSTESRHRGILMHAWFQTIEWLDDGRPDRAQLDQVARAFPFQRPDLASLIEDFLQALDRPALAALLSRLTYQRPQAERFCSVKDTESPGEETDEGANAIQGKGPAPKQPRSPDRVATTHPRDPLSGCMAVIRPGVDLPKWKVWRERSFAFRQGDTILGGTIDRLVALYDGDCVMGADVVDFKTDVFGDDPLEGVAARLEYYRPQLEAYRRAAARLLGLDVTQVSARIAFVEPGLVLEV